MAPQLNQYNVILLEAASDEENPDDIPWPMLRTYLRGAKVDTSERTEGEWMRSFQNFRRIIREDNERTSEDQSPSVDLETKSDGASTSDSGYISGDHSESAQDKNGEQHLLHLAVKSGLYPGDETAPVGCRYTDAVEGNYISQTIYERFQLQKDSDGMLNLTFFNKERSRTIVKRCRVVPDDQGIADVVFGKEPPKPSKSTEDGGDKSQHKEACDSRSGEAKDKTRARIEDPAENYIKREREKVMVLGIGHCISNIYKDHAAGAFHDDLKARELGWKIGLTMDAATGAAMTFR